jgi:pyrimidine-nucleoside phosphorylase
MDAITIIEKKRDNAELSTEEIFYFVDEYAEKNTIPDYQASAFLMAVFFNGMSDRELKDFTNAMIQTGQTLDFSAEEGTYVDKHSSGGVGDKTSIVLCPIFAALGLKVAKMSGRGLGFTGGTLDKLESIPGYDINLDDKDFFEQVRRMGLAIIGQSDNMVLADKRFYSLRDVTATVDSIPLIASSIMSKKIAAGSECILLDVKYGDGAFMQTPELAISLAKRMKAIGELFNRKINCEITSMQDVLGRAVGNALEIKESIDALKGDFEPNFYELIKSSTVTMLKMAGAAETDEQAEQMLTEVIESGAALEKFKEWIAAQGGDARVVEDESILKISQYTADVYAETSGYVNRVNVRDIGVLSAHLGGGRIEITDDIDHSVGLIVYKKIGDKVEKGEKLATIYHKKDEPRIEEFKTSAQNSFIIESSRGEIPPLIAAHV